MVLTANMTSSHKQQRPSDERRERLAQQIVIPVVSNFFPLERYYEAADKVYIELQQLSKEVQAQSEARITMDDVEKEVANDSNTLNYDVTFNHGLDMCYLYAKRYCIFCVDAIPTHNYYSTLKYQSLKQKHTVQMTKVLRMLEHVVNQMDVQERIIEIIQDRKDKEVQSQLLEWQQRIQQPSSASLNNNSIKSSSSIEDSALEKLKILLPPPHSQSIANSVVEATRPSTSSTRYSLPDDDDNDDDGHETIDPDTNIPKHAISLDGIQPMLPPHPPSKSSTVEADSNILVPLQPPTPPSYEAATSKIQMNSRTNQNHSDTSYIKQQQQQRPEQPLPKQPTVKQNIAKPPSMRQLQDYHKAMYNKYLQIGKIKISSIDTYQGRVSESTNGCTVISALVVARHLQDNKPFTMISDTMVQGIIDRQCGPILRVIRQKLGLGGHALIIPSDVHDHLVDEKILLQEYFAGAAGGNIMNREHYIEFLQLLSNTDKKDTNGKAGATLFFREHVISIVKSVDSTTKQSYYDLIDSMPGIYMNGKSMATRTRCYDVQSLEILLLWYASRKFSDTNCQYIDRTPWDDNTADFDPRVFQGFVWST